MIGPGSDKKRSKRVHDIVGQNVVGNVYSGDPDVDVDGQQNLGVGCKTVLRLWDLNWGLCVSQLWPGRSTSGLHRKIR